MGSRRQNPLSFVSSNTLPFERSGVMLSTDLSQSMNKSTDHSAAEPQPTRTTGILPVPEHGLEGRGTKFVRRPNRNTPIPLITVLQWYNARHF